MTRRLRGNDEGAALIMVLVLVTVAGLGVGSLLTLADTSLRTSVNLRAQAAGAADAEGAVQAAVTNIRTSTYRAGIGSQCFGADDTLSLPAFDGTTSAAVACTADPATVLIQCPSLTRCNRPGSAILTLGTDAGEDGLRITQPNTSSFRVHGSVFSNSAINVANGNLATTGGGVYARGTCTGPITPAPSCSYAGASPLGADPGYSPDVSVVPPWRPVPDCTTPNSVVRFSPGYYDDAYKLSDMMAGNSRCKHSTWWFQPGTYYFDFHNAGTTSNPLLSSSGGNVWTINDGTLVAGTPVDAMGARVAAPAVPAAIPGSCANPINDATAVGVQFIFGGDSQMVVRGGQAEICGTYHATRPPVAIYGLTSGAESTASTTLKVTGVPAPGDFGTSATPANLSAVDGTAFATWTGKKKNDSGAMTVAGFAPPSAIPAGSVLTAATLRVVHRHADAGSSDTLDVGVTPSGGSAMSATLAGHPGSSTWQPDTAPLDVSRTSPIAAAVYAGTFTGASIAVTAGLVANNDTEAVDAVQLDLTYVPPALRAGTGCLTTVPYSKNSSTACAVVSTAQNPDNRFYVQGTTYTPGAVVDVNLNNEAEQVFRFGVIARALWLNQTGSFAYLGPVIEVPDDAPGFGLMLYLTAYVCPGAASCQPTGTAALRAKVMVVDGDPANPTAGQRQIAVLSWVPSG